MTEKRAAIDMILTGVIAESVNLNEARSSAYF